MGPVAQLVFKTSAVVQPTARSVRLRRRSVPCTKAGFLRVSRIALLGLSRRPALFLDDQEVFVPLHDVLDLRILVARQHDEVGRYGADRFVFSSSGADLLRAGGVVALAEKPHQN